MLIIDPLSKKARIVAIAAVLAILGSLAVFTTKETTPAETPQPAPKIEATEPSPQIGEGISTVVPAPEPPKAVKPVPAAPKSPEHDFAGQTDAKAYLASILATERDFKIMEAVIQCESGWEHYWLDTRAGHIAGTVKVSSGNIGFGQINVVHIKRAASLGLDVYKQKDNLTFVAQLYREQGVNPWLPYSGHCFVPKLKAQGIEL